MSLRSLLLVLGSVIFAVAAAEIVLRIAGFDYPSFYIPENVTGAMLRPGAEGWHLREGPTYITINSAGLRDREHETAKPAGTVRIAVLGDSYAEALQVPLQKTFWALLERDLNGCKAYGGRKVEVINFGVSGYGTAQELLALRHRAWAYSPDIVLLAFLPANDVRNNSRALEHEKTRPFFEIRDGELVLDDSYTREPGHRLRTNAVWRFLRDHSRVMMLESKARNAFGADRRGTTLDEQVYVAPSTTEWLDAWTTTERLILAMNDEVRAQGARMLLAILTSGESVHPDPAARERYVARVGAPDLWYPDRRVRDLGERHGFPVVQLGPRMRQYAESTGVHLHNVLTDRFGHWNEEGHRVAGQIISQRLCESQAEASRTK